MSCKLWSPPLTISKGVRGKDPIKGVRGALNLHLTHILCYNQHFINANLIIWNTSKLSIVQKQSCMINNHNGDKHCVHCLLWFDLSTLYHDMCNMFLNYSRFDVQIK